jgi:hypothetical protein
MTKGVSSKHQREDRLRLRRQRLQDASGALQGAKSPLPRLFRVPTRPGRPSVPPAHRYPAKRVSLGDRQAVAPIGRGDK